MSLATRRQRGKTGTRRAEKGLAAEPEQLPAIFTAIRRASSRYLAVTCNLQPH